MTDPGASPSLDERRYQLDLRKLELEESWPRKWGSVIISAAATLCVALISAGVSVGQNWMQQNKAAAEHAQSVQQSELAAERAIQQSNLAAERENDRMALNLYFQYVGTAQLARDELQRRLDLIQALTHNSDVKRAISLGRASTPLEQAPSTAFIGTPDLTIVAGNHAYGPEDFRAYVQYFIDRRPDSEKVIEALGNLNLRVPGAEAMPRNKTPLANQIRIYRADHKTYAKTLAGQLKQTTNLDFRVVGPIGGGKLPNGVIEIWIGHST